MRITATLSPSETQKGVILQLWNNEYPAQLGYNGICELDTYLETLSDVTHFFAEDATGEIIGWAFVFTRMEERWFAVIVDSSIQGSGVGTALLHGIKQQESVLNGWAIDHGRYLRATGEPYRSPLEFYLKNGFSVIHHRRIEVDKLSAVLIKWEKRTNTLTN